MLLLIFIQQRNHLLASVSPSLYGNMNPIKGRLWIKALPYKLVEYGQRLKELKIFLTLLNRRNTDIASLPQHMLRRSTATHSLVKCKASEPTAYDNGTELIP